MSSGTSSTVRETATNVNIKPVKANNAASAPSTVRSALRLDPYTVLLFLLGFRLLNALTIQTFFQPDEYFQALEPAWQLAFGVRSGAWITWEWKHHLRSAIHPTIFATCYKLADSLSQFLQVTAHTRAEILLVTPKILQAGFAALGDFYTWKLASHVYGTESPAGFSALLLTIVSPWQWFCSTRTFSNSLETTLTILALYNWPWHWAARSHDEVTKATDPNGQAGSRASNKSTDSEDEITLLRRTLLCAAVAVILRPTNLLVWIVLSCCTFISTWGGRTEEVQLFVREAVLCGTTILLSSTIVDRIFYDAWVFPPFNFLRVNVLESLASFYGNNDWHYYVSQGYPLLLMTALPFTLCGFSRIWSSKKAVDVAETTPAASKTLRMLSMVCVLVPAAFSFISHKEVRFIYPLLPALHIISAAPLARFLQPFLIQKSSPDPGRFSKGLLLAIILSINLSIGYYTTQTHNSGIINLTKYLRSEFETQYMSSSPPRNMTMGTFMPCHSTPWRSHLLYPPSSATPGIKGWALTCEPPLKRTLTEYGPYLDEADQFYANPALFVRKHMSHHIPGVSLPSASASPGKLTTINPAVLEQERTEMFWATGLGRKPWPDYLMFFAQLEDTMKAVLRGSRYGECYRVFNSHWHDDSRRVGDVVVWCLDEERLKEWKGQVLGSGHEAAQDGIRAGLGRDAGGEEESNAVVGQKILGGPGTKRSDGNKGEDPKEPFRRVVEKPFWKHREPEED